MVEVVVVSGTVVDVVLVVEVVVEVVPPFGPCTVTVSLAVAVFGGVFPYGASEAVAVFTIVPASA